jgi:hypothetical protein
MSYLVLSVRPYSFEADDGRNLSGASVTYIDLDAEPLQDQATGFAPLTISAPARLTPDFPKVPGMYQLHFTQRRGKGGRPVLALGGATLERPVDLHSL